VDLDGVAKTCERFVDRIIYDFINDMMRPNSPVDPMYIAGRLRTASRPSRT
jgi:hypothetical protein